MFGGTTELPLGHAETRRPRRHRHSRSAMRNLDDITEGIIDAAIQIHRDLGPGLPESVDEGVLARALEPPRPRASA